MIDENERYWVARPSSDQDNPVKIANAGTTWHISARSAWRLYESLRDTLNAAGVKPPETPVRTVPVRIAVAVDDRGNCQAAGSKERGEQASDETIRDAALEYLFSAALDVEVPQCPHVVYVTASVPLPQSVEVQGSVET